MKAPDAYGDRPYFPISRYYLGRFGRKVHKITVSAANSCPHRDGKKNGKGCLFCDEWGSAGHHLAKVGTLEEQIVANREKLRNRYRADRFLVYFQPFTNTHTELRTLRENIETALRQDQVCGVVLGTRPDCLPDEVLSLLNRCGRRDYMAVELGVQSLYNPRLAFLNRRHTAEQSIGAIEKLHRLTNVDIGLHLMFGLPEETEEEITETAKRINDLPVSSVKLHNLHVLSHTPLESLYREGSFQPVELHPYAQKVAAFLAHLSPNIAVQRLAAVAPRWDALVAPRWTKERMRPTQYIIAEMKKKGIYQGMYFQ